MKGEDLNLEQQVQMYKNMVKKYKFDYITGMKQRRDFEYETGHKFEHQEFYLMMFDIVGLHSINREQGYEAGDNLIRQVANDIQYSDGVWESYRIGGDEFMVLYFEEPKDIRIDNATSAYVFSGDYTSFKELKTEVDLKVTNKKNSLKRRKDENRLS